MKRLLQLLLTTNQVLSLFDLQYFSIGQQAQIQLPESLTIEQIIPQGLSLLPDPNDIPLSECQDRLIDMTNFFGDLDVKKAMCTTLHTELNVVDRKLIVIGFFDCNIQEDSENFQVYLRLKGSFTPSQLLNYDPRNPNKIFKYTLGDDFDFMSQGLKKENSYGCNQLELLIESFNP